MLPRSLSRSSQHDPCLLTADSPSRRGAPPRSSGPALLAAAAMAAATLGIAAPASAGDLPTDPSRCTSPAPDAAVVSTPDSSPTLSQGSMSRTLVHSYTTGTNGGTKPSASFPSLAAWDTVTASGAPNRTVATSFSDGADDPDADNPPVDVFSTDGGRTFPASSYERPGPIAFTGRLLDGRVFSTRFKPKDGTSGRTFTFDGSISDSAGAHFTDRTVTLTASSAYDAAGSWTRIAGAPLVLGDGAVLQPYYGQPGKTGPWHAELAISHDGGATFTHLSTIDPGNGYDASETAVAELGDGTLIAAFRTENRSTSHYTIRYARSTDRGATWSTPVDMKISLDGSAPTSRFGVTPAFQVMPSGMVVLASGRPDTWLAMSPTGGPDDWKGVTTYRNCPVSKAGINGSSANTGLVISGPTSVLQSGDNCAVWGCGAEDRYTVSREQFTWVRSVEALPAGSGRMDLTGMLASGPLSVDTNMTWTSADHPRARVSGAVDGSLEPWSSAVAAGQDGTYTLDLKRPFVLSRIGLSLAREQAASASVQTSSDGTTWSARTDLADVMSRGTMTYADLKGVSARYVRITVPQGDHCQGAMPTCAILNEVELWSDEDSFENDPLYNRPRGFVDSPSDPKDAESAWVEARGATGSTRALRLYDASTATQAHIRKVRPASTSATVSFTLYPVKIASAAMFDLMSGSRAAVHLAAFPDGSVRAWDGSAWKVALPAGTVKIGASSRITVTASPSGARVAVGTASAAVPRVNGAGTSIDGVQFASGGTKPSGDDLLLDDLEIR